MNVKVLTLLIPMILMGCTVTEQVKSPYQSQQMVAMSSIHDQPIALSTNAKFSIDPLISEIRPQKFYENQEHAYEVIQSIVKQDLEQQGFKYTHATMDEPEFYFGFLLVSDEIISDEEYNRIFRINPGLKSNKEHPKGTLLIYILNKESEFVWRGALQGFMDESQKESVRQQRAQSLVNKLMAQFYTGI